MAHGQRRGDRGIGVKAWESGWVTSFLFFSFIFFFFFLEQPRGLLNDVSAAACGDRRLGSAASLGAIWYGWAGRTDRPGLCDAGFDMVSEARAKHDARLCEAARAS
ncbi:hypothetical protein M0R45_016556 [Rubus argutus]|uniref:Uncharacterized protein n=1 Tax=Rubus argutus TaxID=59490 RepID=A0AAW1XSX2_RUBAR